MRIGKAKHNPNAEAESLAAYSPERKHGYSIEFTEMMGLGMSVHGSWSHRQLLIATGARYPAAGWRRKREGLFAPDSVSAEFIALKDKHLPPEATSKDDAHPDVGEAVERCKGMFGCVVDLENMPFEAVADLLLIAEAYYLLTNKELR